MNTKATEGIAPLTIISPKPPSASRALYELWDYRELLFFFAWKDLSVRYKQTSLGIAWAILEPLIMMSVMAIFIGTVADIDTGSIPYPVFVFSSFLPWRYFSSTFSSISLSLVSNQHIITKIYFPRLAIPISKLIPPLLDFVLAIAMLFPLAVLYPTSFAWTIALCPVALLLLGATSLGLGLWTTALNVRFRDLGYLVPFFLQIVFLASPIMYPTSSIPTEYRLFYSLNPVVTPLEIFRWCCFGEFALEPVHLAISVSMTIALLISGLLFFNRVERSFADVI